jgi:hypothetical protein
MEEIQIRCRNRNRRVVARVPSQVPLRVLKADRRQFTYRPSRNREEEEEVAGSAWTEKWFSSRKGMFGRDARNVTDRKKKRGDNVLLILLNKRVGAALTDRSSRPPRRIARREKVNATVPEEKRGSIVTEENIPLRRPRRRIIAEENKPQRRPRRRIIERRQRRIRLRNQRHIRRRDQHPVAPVTPTTSWSRIQC